MIFAGREYTASRIGFPASATFQDGNYGEPPSPSTCKELIMRKIGIVPLCLLLVAFGASYAFAAGHESGTASTNHHEILEVCEQPRWEADLSDLLRHSGWLEQGCDRHLLSLRRSSQLPRRDF